MADEANAATNEHAGRVRDMFANIAARYDLLNHLLSANIDRRWRRLVAKKVAQHLPKTDGRVLDVACGTGDLAITLFETTGASVIGTDFCRPMLEIAARKTSQSAIPFVEGDALSLPFRDGSFNAVTVGFGLRNFASVDKGLREFYRVLGPGGRVAVLECSRPVVPGFRWLFGVYFTKVVPLMGNLISGSRYDAYTYLPNSVTKFPDQEMLAQMMQQVGFEDVHYENLTGGVVALHLGRRPE